MRVIPLHLHSHWSLLDGVPSVRELIAFAQQLNFPAIALTDSNALYPAVEFIGECRKAKTQPLLGAELNLAGGHSIILLARNMTGYRNLCRLITHLQVEPDREIALKRGLPLSDLAPHSEGLVALSGSAQGPLDAPMRRNQFARAESLANELIQLFGADRFIIELQIIEKGDTEKAQVLQALAGRLPLRTVATQDIHYLSPADAPRYRVLTTAQARSVTR